jgi:hypothetical protein
MDIELPGVSHRPLPPVRVGQSSRFVLEGLTPRLLVPALVDRAALHRHAVPYGGDGLVEPRRAVDDEELGPLQSIPPDKDKSFCDSSSYETCNRRKGPIRWALRS